ncbi:MAG TPA: protein-disulfide reductase DsbD domain-containing protein, partial [Chthoniobacteraceae bacterium]|nr:protein-disulfide reductase DsbD domain-containing protein [Chthoniobacteraceae bacterium]
MSPPREKQTRREESFQQKRIVYCPMHMRKLCHWLFLIVLLGVFSIGLRAQELNGRQLVVPTLLAETDAVAPGKPFTVGVIFIIADGWHTYWQFGGDSGAPPTIEWELPPGFKAGPIQFPLPTTHVDEGDLLTYIYERQVMFLAEITPPAEIATDKVALKANLKWLVCEKTCIPADGSAELTLPVSSKPNVTNAEMFAQWRALLPKSEPPPFKVQWETQPQKFLIHADGISSDAKISFFPLPQGSEVQLGHPSTAGTGATRTITVPFEGNAGSDVVWRGVLAQERAGKREGWQIASARPPAAAGSPASARSIGTDRIALAPANQPLLSLLAFAFLGGLILNLMPCVLPVIALKIFGFVKQAGESRERIFQLGLAFAAGIFAFFLALAAVVVAFHLAGHGLSWGFQFQNPVILLALIALVFAFALSMFGVFEITLGGGTATRLDALGRRDGPAGAFAQGLFTTLLGTSCTAPFLGPVLGFAFAQPPHIIFLVFAVIAAGMALPYLLLTWQPAWMRFLPKPGAWMERLKQLMGFVLMAVAVWLLGVLAESRGVTAASGALAFLLALGLACWIFGTVRNRALSWISIVLILAGAWLMFVHGNITAAPVQSGKAQTGAVDGIAWEKFSPER